MTPSDLLSLDRSQDSQGFEGNPGARAIDGLDIENSQSLSCLSDVLFITSLRSEVGLIR